MLGLRSACIQTTSSFERVCVSERHLADRWCSNCADTYSVGSVISTKIDPSSILISKSGTTVKKLTFDRRDSDTTQI
jgi:hypothetical protein